MTNLKQALLKQDIEKELGRGISNITINDNDVDFTDANGNSFYAKLTKTGKMKKNSVRGFNG